MAYIAEVKGDKLIITVDISATAKQSAPLSKTGKSRLLASSGGFQNVAPGVAINLNVAAK